MVGEMEGLLFHEKTTAIFTAFYAVNSVDIRRRSFAGTITITGSVHMNVQSRIGEQPEDHFGFSREWFCEILCS